MLSISFNKTLKKNIGSSYLGLIFSLLSGFLLPPLAISYFGEETFGIWIAISSLGAYFNSGILGLDNSITLLLPLAKNKKDKTRLALWGFWTVAVVSVIIAIVFTILLLVSPSAIQNTKFLDSNRIELSLFIGLLLLNLPFSVFQGVLPGLNKLHIENILRGFGVLNSIISILVTSLFQGDLITFIFCYSFFNYSISFIRIIIILKIENSSKDEDSNNKFSYIKFIKLGLSYFLFGISVVIISNFDYIYIGSTLGSVEVTQYWMSYRIINIAFNFVMFLNGSFFPMLVKAFSEAQEKNKINTFVSLIYRANKYDFILKSFFVVGLTLFASDFIFFWTNKTVVSSPVLITLLCIFAVLYSRINLNVILLNSMRENGKLALFGFIEAGLHILLSIVLIPRFFISGAAISAIVSTLLSGYTLTSVAVYYGIKKVNYRFKISRTFIDDLIAIFLSCSMLFISERDFLIKFFVTLFVGVCLIFFYLINDKIEKKKYY